MQNVGKTYNRNKEFFNKFTKAEIIKRNINRENPICFDIGAYQGQSVEFLRRVFKEPLIHSFEPSPKNYEVLKSKKYKNNRCYNLAVSNFSGETTFCENRIAHTSSLF